MSAVPAPDEGMRRVRVVHWQGEEMVVEQETWLSRTGGLALVNIRPGVSVHIEAEGKDDQ